MKLKPGILKDYFKWHHTPSKGDSITLPDFGDEMVAWWGSVQPKWRYKNEYPPDCQKDYSFILAGGKKGVYLLILCLAWWDREYGRNLEKERVRLAGRGARKDDTTLDSNELLIHEYKWFNIVNDLICVMELAQGWPVPGDGTSATTVTPTRKRRMAGKSEASSPQKKKARST